MNIILFNSEEIDKPLACRDPRAVHILKVLHKKSGDSFDAGVIGGKTGTAKIKSISKNDDISFSLNLTTESRERLSVYIGVGFVRPIQLRRLLRDLCSMGVAGIDLFGTELGDKNYTRTNLFKDGGAQQALIEGAVQGRDTILPELSVYHSLHEWLNICTEKHAASLKIVCDNVDTQNVFQKSNKNACKKIVLAIGSERGWSEHERGLFADAGFLPKSLGCRALRTETACIAACALAANLLLN
ncbi:MAG: 16S rRNA (uracil(1498)-N(3))-methyltransferase [Termitinemataceae bacterium]|nr:MAG: 16S rRNA (uracil(1498)-N(3))-methyltransferase [Termitinemataceae bacterium]